ncbi:acyltransferase [Spirochaetota bacterium]
MIIHNIKIAMKERELKGLFGFIRYFFSYIFGSYLLILLAEHAPNALVNVFHRMRGITIGRNVFIDRSVQIDGAFPRLVSIEDGVRIAPNVVIMAHFKAGDELREKYYPLETKPVKICSGAFIGVSSVILPGVTVGKCAIIAAGSIVSQDVPPYTVAAGNPARIVKKITENPQQ